MALPTGSNGQSWREFAPPPEVGARTIEKNLPISASVLYEAPLGLFAQCIGGNLFIGSVFAFGTSSFTLEQQPSPAIQKVSWSLSTTTAPGIFDTIFFVLGGQQLQFSINDGNFHFAFVQGYGDPLEASGSRRGMLITSLSAQPSETFAESPHMSFEPSDFGGTLLPGDLWFASGVLPVRPGLRMVDSAVSGASYIGSFLTARATESVSELVARFGTADSPSGTLLGLKAVVVDEGLVTVASDGIGPLIRNDTWGGGFFMPSSGTVAVFGTAKEFLVPSGNFTVLTGADIISGTLNVFSGSIYIQGDNVRLEISGQSASMFINNQPVASVTVSNVRIDQGAGTPALPDGVIYLTPSASTSNLDEAFIRASGTWVPIVTESFGVLDGGFFGP